MVNIKFILITFFVLLFIVGMGCVSWGLGGWVGLVAYICGLFTTTILPDLILRKSKDRIYLK